MNKLMTIEGIIGLVLVCIVIIMILYSSFFSDYDIDEVNLEQKNLEMSEEHYFGTDSFGRDIFTRVLFGGRYSVGTAFIALTIAFVISILYGIISGYIGGKLELILTAISDIAMAFPPMVIILSLIGVFSASIQGLVIAIIIASWPWYAKIIRSLVMTEKSKGYVTAAKVCGSNHLKIVYMHILPNIRNTVIVMYVTGISNMILMFSSFSYLGIGFSKEIPEWGSMLSNAKSNIFTRPELMIIPGICILVTSLGFNLIGEAIGAKDKITAKHKVRLGKSR